MEKQLPRLPYPKGCTKTKRPTMKNHRGRTWDSFVLFLPDGRKALGNLDTTWGDYFYWQDPRHGYWMKAKIADFIVGECFDLREERYGVQIGQKVRLKPGLAIGQPYHDPDMTATISIFYDDIDGGLRVEPMLGGFNSWNIADLIPIYDNTIRIRAPRA